MTKTVVIEEDEFKMDPKRVVKDHECMELLLECMTDEQLKEFFMRFDSEFRWRLRRVLNG